MQKIIAYKFPGTAILILWRHRVALLLKAELLLFETIGQHSDIMKSKMVVRGKFKSDN